MLERPNVASNVHFFFMYARRFSFEAQYTMCVAEKNATAPESVVNVNGRRYHVPVVVVDHPTCATRHWLRPRQKATRGR
jgi:hypothetical protein